jgi:hypothetical protein
VPVNEVPVNQVPVNHVPVNEVPVNHVAAENKEEKSGLESIPVAVPSLDSSNFLEDFIEIDSENRIPLFSVFIPTNPSQQQTVEITQIESLFSQMNISNKNIIKIDPSTDYELISILKLNPNDPLVLPVAFLRRKRLGGLEELSKLSQLGTLRTMIDEVLSQEDIFMEERPPQLGMINRALGGVISYINPWYWFRRETKASDNHPEFEVTHSNWYFQQRSRKLVLTDQHFLRLQPDGEVCAAHKYSELEKVSVKDTTLIFYYLPGVGPDYFFCSHTDLAIILKTLSNYHPSLKINERKL